MTRKPMTPHQAEVFRRIANRTLRGFTTSSEHVGCRGACIHLRAKGWIAETEITGPRGGTTYSYSAVMDEQGVRAHSRLQEAWETRGKAVA